VKDVAFAHDDTCGFARDSLEGRQMWRGDQ
jgi:hypothetical protein